MTVELICVGTEILLGNIVNTNAAYLAEKVALLGLSCYHQSVVGDNRERLEDTVRLALSRSDIVILSGGLGPTADDITKEACAEVFGQKLVEDPHTFEKLRCYFETLHTQKANITENNWKQALIPEYAKVVDNHNGTAPGLILQNDEGKRAILLPGPPNELKAMFEADIMPFLGSLQPEGIYSHMAKVCGIGESRAETIVADLMAGQTNPTIAPYAKMGEVHFRVTARADSEDKAERLMEPVLSELKKRFGYKLFTLDESETLEENIVHFLVKHKLTVTTAESCTAGLLAARIMNVPGASDCYNEGYITYSNEAKAKLLDVSMKTLEMFGAVSAETAAEMARGAARAADADAALAVTGIAGPGGGTPEKPVGLVYIGCYLNGKTITRELHFFGNRNKVRELSAAYALTTLREELLISYADQNN